MSRPIIKPSPSARISMDDRKQCATTLAAGKMVQNLGSPEHAARADASVGAGAIAIGTRAGMSVSDGLGRA